MEFLQTQQRGAAGDVSGGLFSIDELEQELANVLAENEQLADENYNDENQNIWYDRYQELLEQ